jgi:hypothetical protein
MSTSSSSPLAEPDVDDASLTHTGRPLVIVPMMGDDPVPDHVVHVAVRDGWGYLIYAGGVSPARGRVHRTS